MNNEEEILFSKNTRFTNAITSSGDISGSGTSTGSFGQLELSGAPLKTIHDTCKEINNHLAFTKKLEEKYKED